MTFDLHAWLIFTAAMQETFTRPLHQGHIPGTPCLPGCPEWKPLPGIRR